MPVTNISHTVRVVQSLKPRRKGESFIMVGPLHVAKVYKDVPNHQHVVVNIARLIADNEELIFGTK